MEIPDTHAGMQREITNYLIGNARDLPETVLSRLVEAQAQMSPVPICVHTLEILYAARDDLDDDGRRLVVKLAGFIGASGFHSDVYATADARGRGIQLAMMRELGEPAPVGVEYPEAEADPEPAERFVGEPTPPGAPPAPPAP